MEVARLSPLPIGRDFNLTACVRLEIHGISVVGQYQGLVGLELLNAELERLRTETDGQDVVARIDCVGERHGDCGAILADIVLGIEDATTAT